MPAAGELVAARGVVDELWEGRRRVGVVVAARGKAGSAGRGAGAAYPAKPSTGELQQAERRRAPDRPGAGELQQAELRRGMVGRGGSGGLGAGRPGAAPARSCSGLERGSGRGSGAGLQRPGVGSAAAAPARGDRVQGWRLRRGAAGRGGGGGSSGQESM
jgi:hypothetical protein